MTTIAATYRVGRTRKPIGTIAADTFSHAPGIGYTITKIVGIGSTLVGCAGQADACNSFIAWRKGGSTPKFSKTEQFEALVVDATGIYLYVNSIVPDRLRGNTAGFAFHAIGSGRQYALGALASGASPRKAVEIACAFDPFSKTPVEELHLGKT